MKNSLLNKMYKKYKLSESDIKYLNDIILPIYNHSEFQRRCTNEFSHHGSITLGEHIIEDTIITYLSCKKKKSVDTKLSIKISMLHDLYTIPWQNNKKEKSSFFHLHGFVHPIEAVINSINWYPELFIDEKESFGLIDGIIHHMFPLPVTCFEGAEINKLELVNYNLISNIDSIYIDMIISSTKRNKIGIISFSRSKTREGRIVSFSDKKGTLKELRHFEDAKAFITGHNKRIEKK